MCELLSTSHATINANDNIENKPHFCLDLLANLEHLLRSVDPRLIILGIFDPFSPLLYGMIVEQNKTLLKYDVFLTS